MSLRLTKLQKKLCTLLQEGLPICSRPFAGIAKVLDSDEEEILCQVKQLKDEGIIRRISALLNYRALGRTSTLVAAHVPEDNLKKVIEAVNSLENVSHNYLRRHYYNLWFTLQAESSEQILVTLSNLNKRFDIEFHSLPAKRFFKLDVRFDAEEQGRLLLRDIEQISKSKTAELNDKQKLILSKLQNGLEPTAKPFDFLCNQSLKTDEVLGVIKELIDKAVIRRIAAVVDHRKLGFVANELFCAEVTGQRINKAGKALAGLPIVSHCCERKTLQTWPYNLFAMMHARTDDEIEKVISAFVKTEGINSFQLLPTAAELKKQPVKYRFC